MKKLSGILFWVFISIALLGLLLKELHMPFGRPVVLVGFAGMFITQLLKFFIRAKRTPPSPAMKMILIFAAVAVLGLILKVGHLPMAQGILSMGLAGLIAGYIYMLATLPPANYPMDKRVSALLLIITITILIGMLLRINHIPYGKPIANIGMVALGLIAVGLVALRAVRKRKSTEQ